MELGKKFEELVKIMARLRGPNGCPWDREQTHDSIAPNLLEETYEVLQAIAEKKPTELTEELGDLLLQVVFHAQMLSDAGAGSIGQVIDQICDKLIRRHPHVFGEATAGSTREVLQNWEAIKQSERKGKKEAAFFSGIPPPLPALLKAFRLGEKAGRVGFDWGNIEGIEQKIEEELAELEAAQKSGDTAQIEAEYGDLLFTLANLGRFLKIDPETALRKAGDRFIARFHQMEKEIAAGPKPMQALSADEWEKLWGRAKKM